MYAFDKDTLIDIYHFFISVSFPKHHTLFFTLIQSNKVDIDKLELTPSTIEAIPLNFCCSRDVLDIF